MNIITIVLDFFYEMLRYFITGRLIVDMTRAN